MAHLALFAYTAFYIGRVHELFAVLAPPRIVFALGLTSVALALLTPSHRRNRVLSQPEVRIVLSLGLLGVLFMPFGVWPGGSWTFLTDSFSRVLVFFLLVVALATSRRAIQNLLWSVLTGVTFLGILTIIGGNSIVSAYGGRAYASSTYDPNEVAMMMVCTLPLAAFGAVALRGVGRIVAVGTTLTCILATLMTMSRGGFVGLIFVSVLLLFRLGTARMAPRLIILGIIVTFLAAAAPARYWDVMWTIWNPKGSGEYLERGVFARVELWKEGVNLFLGNPLTGVGIGTYEVAEGLSHGGRGKWSTAHNSFLQLATELGLLGFVLFTALLVLSLRNTRRTLRMATHDPRLRDLTWISAAVETSFYTYIVEGFALSQAYSPMLYFLIGIAVALRLEARRRKRAPTAATAPAQPATRSTSMARPSTASRPLGPEPSPR